MMDEIRRGRQHEEDPIEMSPGAWIKPLGTDVPSITCPRCGMTSWNGTDTEQGYCGNCHDWTSAR